MISSKYFKASTFIVTSACFALLISCLTIGVNLKKMLTMWGDDVQMTVYLKEDLNVGVIADLKEKLAHDPRIGTFKYIPKEQAVQDFKVHVASYAPDLANDNDLGNVVPSSFEISLMGAVDVADQSRVLNLLGSELKAMPGVEEVTWGQEWIKKYAALVSTGEIGFAVIGVVLVLASIFVISNIILDEVSSKRKEIEILELVGATASFIRKPFLKQGAVIGSASMISGTIISYGLFLIGKDFLKEHLAFLQLGEHLEFLSGVYLIFLFSIGCVIGLAASWAAVSKINTGWAASGSGTSS